MEDLRERKRPLLGAAFLFLTLYYQNTKSSELECQLLLKFPVYKWRVMSGHYFGEEVRLLTKKEDMAKGERNSVQRAAFSVQKGRENRG
jgi:hypothetical protein